jgi:SAM-dependent methyltransferase
MSNIGKTNPNLVGSDGMPNWRTLYDKMPVESMPWFNPKLDPDLARTLSARGIKHGNFLDLGAGPGTQAIELARLGFDVTGTDISPKAVTQAKERAAETKARFVVDDILATSLNEKFDLIFDRGCFHVFESKDHAAYLKSLGRLLAPGGTFFLKCFSAAEPGTTGPKRYTREDLGRIFGGQFDLLSVEDTVYYGNVGGSSPLDHEPRSLFAVMRRK